MSRTGQQKSPLLFSMTFWPVFLVLGMLPAGFHSAPATIKAVKPVHIVALGAGNTRGKGLSRSRTYPAYLESMLQEKGIVAKVSNAGVNGDTIARMLARLDGSVPNGTRLVILQPGDTDFKLHTDILDYRANIAEIKYRLKERGIKVVMLQNRLLNMIDRKHMRAIGRHFKPSGYKILAQRILPRVIEAIRPSSHLAR